MRCRRLDRCATCGLNAPLCVCASLPRLAPATRIIVIAHRFELFKSTNTAKLAVRMLGDSELRTRGDPLGGEKPAPGPGSFVLFPGADGISMSEAAARGVGTLVVPDGTWAQAKRIARRDPACHGLTCVRLESPLASRYRLRRNSRPDGLCTLEAIAEALRVLEGDVAAEAMLASFLVWVERSERVRAGAHEQALPVPDLAPVG